MTSHPRGALSVMTNDGMSNDEFPDLLNLAASALARTFTKPKRRYRS